MVAGKILLTHASDYESGTMIDCGEIAWRCLVQFTLLGKCRELVIVALDGCSTVHSALNQRIAATHRHNLRRWID